MDTDSNVHAERRWYLTKFTLKIEKCPDVQQISRPIAPGFVELQTTERLVDLNGSGINCAQEFSLVIAMIRVSETIKMTPSVCEEQDVRQEVHRFLRKVETILCMVDHRHRDGHTSIWVSDVPTRA